MNIPTLLTIKQFSAAYPQFPEGGVRHRVFYAETNGLAKSGAIVRNGRNIYINVEKWYAWIMGETAQGKEAA